MRIRAAVAAVFSAVGIVTAIATAPANVGHYEDIFRKIDGAWFLASRTVFLPFGGGTERLPVADGSPA